MGRRLPPSSPKRALVSQASPDFLRKFPDAPPILLSSLHLFVLYRKVTEALRKHVGLDFLHGNNFFTNFKWFLLVLGFRNFPEALRRPRNHFLQWWGEVLSAILAQVNVCLARKIPGVAPLFAKFTLFCLFFCFSLFSFRNVTEIMAMGV